MTHLQTERARQHLGLYCDSWWSIIGSGKCFPSPTWRRIILQTRCAESKACWRPLFRHWSSRPCPLLLKGLSSCPLRRGFRNGMRFLGFSSEDQRSLLGSKNLNTIGGSLREREWYWSLWQQHKAWIEPTPPLLTNPSLFIVEGSLKEGGNPDFFKISCHVKYHKRGGLVRLLCHTWKKGTLPTSCRGRPPPQSCVFWSRT